MEFTEGRITMNDYIFANMMIENTMLKRDITEKDRVIYFLEDKIKENEKLIDKLWEMIGGNK